MPTGRYYTMDFVNVEQTPVRVLIGDSSVDAETPEYIQMIPADSPVLISTIDEAENKFTPIRAQQATISFLSDNVVSLQTFSDGPDDRFEVTIIYGSTTVFRGFLSLDDNSEAFLPPHNVVTLTANDKLGALKEIPLTDDDGNNPQGKYTIGNLIAMCLKKTGLSLPIRVINNLRHGANTKTIETAFPAETHFFIPSADANFFYVGQQIQISGTASNNVTTTVTAVGVGLFGVIQTEHTFTFENSTPAIFTDLNSSIHIYEGTYLDAKTFEDAVGVSEDCYTVLSKILAYDCFITQYNGAWWICRVDEYDNHGFYVARFDEDGEFVDSYEDLNLNKVIGFDEQETINSEDIPVRYFSDEATIVSPTRPVGMVKLKFNYENPLEVICNQDFERGDFIEDLDDETNEDNTTEQVKAYTFECWESLSRQGASNIWDNYEQPPIAGAKLYVKKYFYNGAETHRELFIEAAPGTGSGASYIKSQPTRVKIADKIRFSVDLRYTNIGSSTGYINTPVMVGLFADSGNIYWWKGYNVLDPDMEPQWVLTNPTSQAIPDWYLGANVEELHSLSLTSPPIPETGDLRIFLINQYGESIRAHYSSMQVDVIAFINGSYQRYEGHYNQITRIGEGYLSTVDDEVYMADADRELFKGAMFFLNGTVYKLTQKWHDAAKVDLGSPDLANVKPYGWHQVFSVWNQFRLSNSTLQYTITGFGGEVPALVHKYSISDVHWSTNDRFFMMLTKEADLKYCTITGVLQQCYHTVEGKAYDDPHEFKYTT